MRSPAMVGAIVVVAFLIGGCPARDQPGEPDPAATADQTPAAQDGDAASTAPPVDAVEPDSQPADNAVSDDTAADPPAEDPPVDGGDVQPPAPALPLTPGMYIGNVTLTEIAHCTGLYATVAGADVHYDTDWPNYGVTIGETGLPNSDDQTVDLGGITVAYTFRSLEVNADSVVVNWLAVVNFTDETTGATYFSMPGEQTDVYRVTGVGVLQIDFRLLAGTSDQFGSVEYDVEMTGDLTRLQ
jgi:hypothetical protein